MGKEDIGEWLLTAHLVPKCRTSLRSGYPSGLILEEVAASIWAEYWREESVKEELAFSRNTSRALE